MRSQARPSPRRGQPRRVGPLSGRARRWAAGAIAAAVFLIFLVLKAYGNHPAASDENIYYYMSVRTAFDGLWPYRDYFFPHPPVHILISVVVFKMAAFLYGLLHGSMAAGIAAMTSGASWYENGLGITVAKSIPAASAAIAGLFVYRAARHGGGVEAPLAAASFLFADQVLRASSHFTGVAEAALFAALGIAALLAGRDRLCGLAFGAGCLVAMYAVPTAAAAWLVLLLISRRRAMAVAVWAVLPLLVVHGLFTLLAGRPYLDGVVLYHLQKPPTARTFADVFWPLLYHDSHLFVALPLAVLAAVLEAFGLLGFPAARPAVLAAPRRAARRREKHDGSRATHSTTRAALADLLSTARLRTSSRRQLLAVALAGTAANLAFLHTLRPVFDFYFVMVFVSTAMLAGYAYGALLRAAWSWARALARGEAAIRFAVALAVLLAGAAAGELWGRSGPARRAEVDDALVGQRVRHEWREAQRLGFVNRLVRATLWTDEEVLGAHYPSVTHYLWHESEVFDAPQQAAAYILAHTAPGATLFGDSYVAPLVALMTGRRVCLDEADTNPMRFLSRITPPLDLIARLEKQPPAVLLVDAFYLASPEFDGWIGRHYELAQPVEDPSYVDLYLYRRKGT